MGYFRTEDDLIAAKADLNKVQESWSGATPLHMAARDGHQEVVQLLIEAGSELNKATKFGATPILVAAQNGHKGVVQELIKANADVNIKNNEGKTPMQVQQGA